MDMYTVYNVLQGYAANSDDTWLRFAMGVPPRKLSIDLNLKKKLDKMLRKRFWSLYWNECYAEENVYAAAIILKKSIHFGINIVALKNAGQVMMVKKKNERTRYYSICTGKVVKLENDDPYPGLFDDWANGI